MYPPLDYCSYSQGLPHTVISAPISDLNNVSCTLFLTSKVISCPSKKCTNCEECNLECQSLLLPSAPNSFSPHKIFRAFNIITLCLSHNVVKAYKNHPSVNSPDPTFEIYSSSESVYNITSNGSVS